MEFRITFDDKKLRKALDAFAFKQLPFAAAQALNGTGLQVIKAEAENEADVLDRPREFTQNSIKLRRASKRSLKAVVFMQDIAAKYLEPYEFGGRNVLNSKALLKPVGAAQDLDRYGNLPRNYLKKLAARSDVFIGTVKTKAGAVNGVWQRSTEDGSAVNVKRTRKGGAAYVGKTRKGGNSSGHLKLLIKFADAHPVKQKLGWFEVAEAAINRSFHPQMVRAFKKALATAKR